MTKLTLKPTTTLSAATQAKLTALLADTVRQTDKHARPALGKTKPKTKTLAPLSQASAKTQAPSQLNTGITTQEIVIPSQSSRDPRSENTAVTQTQGETKPNGQATTQAQRPYRTREEREAYLARIVVAQTWLIETYPVVFSKDTPKPLKLGISTELFPQRPAPISYHQLKDALQAWTHRRAYLQSILDHDQRYDLQGEPVEDIAPEHKDHARTQLEHKQQRFAEQQERRAHYKTKRKLSHEIRDKPGDNTQESKES